MSSAESDYESNLDTIREQVKKIRVEKRLSKIKRREKQEWSDSDDEIPLSDVRRSILALNESKQNKIDLANESDSLKSNYIRAPRRQAAKIVLYDSGDLSLSDSDTCNQLDESDNDPDFILETKTSHKPKITVDEFRINVQEMLGENPNIVSKPSEEKHGSEKSLNTTEHTTNDSNSSMEDTSYTQEQPPEKKKRFSKMEKLEMKSDKWAERVLLNYQVKPGCSNKCKREKPCSDEFSEEDRVKINKLYWSLDFSGRKAFIIDRVIRKNPFFRRPSSTKSKQDCTPIEEFKKKFSFTFRFFKDGSSQFVQVCKSFFLETLGYNQKNDAIITKTFKQIDSDEQNVCVDKRGKHCSRLAEVTIKEITDFIETYNPQVSHYSREKTPLRRYLPTEVNVKKLYSEFCESNPDKKLSYSKFFSAFKTMKISIKQLGNEECEKCEMYKNHQKECICQDICDANGIFPSYLDHICDSMTRRKEYILDKEEKRDVHNMKISVDLQKVILLPRLDTFKSAIFTSRLVTFNETFSQLGKNGEDKAIIWHEALSGRTDGDICSAFHAFISSLRDVKRLTMWLDNCAGQNKNWSLFTMLLYIVNSNDYEVEEIELKYFVSGHSFMSADSAHGRIEQQMREQKKVYDFRDFTQCVKQAKCDVIEMKLNDFRDWQSGTSQYQLSKLGEHRPYMNDIVKARFIKGSEKLHYRKSCNRAEISVDFLAAKFCLTTAAGPIKTTPRGIMPTKKEAILKDIVEKLLPENRKSFWENLPESVTSEDLRTTVSETGIMARGTKNNKRKSN